jgi:hypothetical protein
MADTWLPGRNPNGDADNRDAGIDLSVRWRAGGHGGEW